MHADGRFNATLPITISIYSAVTARILLRNACLQAWVL